MSRRRAIRTARVRVPRGQSHGLALACPHHEGGSLILDLARVELARLSGETVIRCGDHTALRSADRIGR